MHVASKGYEQFPDWMVGRVSLEMPWKAVNPALKERQREKPLVRHGSEATAAFAPHAVMSAREGECGLNWGENRVDGWGVRFIFLRSSSVRHSENCYREVGMRIMRGNRRSGVECAWISIRCLRGGLLRAIRARSQR